MSQEKILGMFFDRCKPIGVESWSLQGISLAPKEPFGFQPWAFCHRLHPVPGSSTPQERAQISVLVNYLSQLFINFIPTLPPHFLALEKGPEILSAICVPRSEPVANISLAKLYMDGSLAFLWWLLLPFWSLFDFLMLIFEIAISDFPADFLNPDFWVLHR